MKGRASWRKTYEKQTKETKGGIEREREKFFSHGEKKSQGAFGRRKGSGIQAVRLKGDERCVQERGREQRWLKCNVDTDCEKMRVRISSRRTERKEMKIVALKIRDRVSKATEEGKTRNANGEGTEGSEGCTQEERSERENAGKRETNEKIERNASKLEIVDGGGRSRGTEGEKFTWRQWRKGGGPREGEGR